MSDIENIEARVSSLELHSQAQGFALDKLQAQLAYLSPLADLVPEQLRARAVARQAELFESLQDDLLPRTPPRQPSVLTPYFDPSAEEIYEPPPL